MNERELKYWAIRKWREHVRAGGHCPYDVLISKLPELKFFICSCSYCQVYHACDCSGCPLKVNDLICGIYGHPYYTWNKYPNIENAIKVLNLIRKIKVTRNELFYRSKNR